MDIDDLHIGDLVFLLIIGIFWLWMANLTPNESFIPENDPMCQYPYKNMGLRGSTNLAICSGIPISLYVLLYIISKNNPSYSYILPFDLIEAIVFHLGSIFFAGIINHYLKLKVGRPRPDFYEFTQKIKDSHIRKEEMIKESFKSFPSGHSCTASSSCCFLSIFLCKIINVSSYLGVALKLTPMFYSIYIGCMRITEHRHHIDDVLAGLFIGILVSVLMIFGGYRSIFTQSLKP